MKTHLLSLLAGTALIATVSVAQAGEPMALSESQMDQVTAGRDYRITATSAENLQFFVDNVLKLSVPGFARNLDLRLTID